MQLELIDLTKKYGNFTALDSLSITFTEGIYGILGANGAGKSTFLNLLSDNLKRDVGSILFQGEEVLKMGIKWREVLGYMPQQQGYYAQMTAETFLFYMAQLKGIRRKEAKAQIDELLEVTNLMDERHRKIGAFSGGMKQRVLLCQALLGNPKVVILDEPTAGVDPKERIRIRNFISSVAQDKIVLLATHIVSDIESISDQVLLMKAGKLIRTGTPEELMESVEGCVREVTVEPKKAEAFQKKYKVGNMHTKDGKMVLRVIGDEFPEGSMPTRDRVTLEDVYLYYLEENPA